MNTLIVGADKTPILEYVKGKEFLLLDDGPLIDALDLGKRKAKDFDHARHHINPLDGMDYRKAREFMAVMDACFPEGENTLTKKNANFILLKALLDEPEYLDTLIEEPRDKKDTAKQDAYQKIQTLMMSPVLKSVLCKRIDPLSLRGIVLARLDRAVLGDFDCFVLGNLLISQFSGQVIIPDGGFYLREHHIALMRQERLVVQVNTLSEVSERLRHALLSISDKRASGALYDDAEVLAKYAGHHPDRLREDNPYNRFVEDAMG